MARTRSGSATRAMPLALELLTADHRKVEDLFRQFEDEKDGDEGTKRALAKRICGELTAPSHLSCFLRPRTFCTAVPIFIEPRTRWSILTGPTAFMSLIQCKALLMAQPHWLQSGVPPKTHGSTRVLKSAL